jgi:hypothetical protein
MILLGADAMMQEEFYVANTSRHSCKRGATLCFDWNWLSVNLLPALLKREDFDLIFGKENRT